MDDVPAELFARLAADPLAGHLGITLEQVQPGYARASMSVGPQLLNAVGMAHGGATMALLDVVHAAVSGVGIGQELDGVVVLAVPLPAMASALDDLAVASDATITDLGSVKTSVLAELGARYGGRFVGGHPMCGTERSGHEATDPRLFAGARWAVCLEPDTDLARWLRVAEVALQAGAEVVPVTAAEHDDAVAAISHVPHLLAAALAAQAGEAGPLALNLAASSFRDGTRVAG